MLCTTDVNNKSHTHCGPLRLTRDHARCGLQMLTTGHTHMLWIIEVNNGSCKLWTTAVNRPHTLWTIEVNNGSYKLWTTDVNNRSHTLWTIEVNNRPYKLRTPDVTNRSCMLWTMDVNNLLHRQTFPVAHRPRVCSSRLRTHDKKSRAEEEHGATPCRHGVDVQLRGLDCHPCCRRLKHVLIRPGIATHIR